MDYYFFVMKYDVVIFDLDGTLLDTLDDLTEGVNHALREFGYPLATREQIRARLGYGSARLIASSLPEGRDCPMYQQVFDSYFEYYRAHSADRTRPYPGIMELLERLKGLGVRIAAYLRRIRYGQPCANSAAQVNAACTWETQKWI